jgi:osmoprotectant transport system permease protein
LDALAKGAIDATDVYTTDAADRALDLVVLAVDRSFFPRYGRGRALPGRPAQRAPRVVAAREQLAGRIDERRMIAANRCGRAREAAVRRGGGLAPALIALGRGAVRRARATGRGRRSRDAPAST